MSLGEVHCPVTAKSGSGDVTVQSVHHASVQANSASGDIAVASTSGSVDLRTASGGLSIGVADQLPAWLDLHSVSGEIRISLESSAEPTPGEPYVSVRGANGLGGHRGLPGGLRPAELDLGPVEVEVGPARRGAALALIVRAGLGRSVRVLGR